MSCDDSQTSLKNASVLLAAKRDAVSLAKRIALRELSSGQRIPRSALVALVHRESPPEMLVRVAQHESERRGFINTRSIGDMTYSGALYAVSKMLRAWRVAGCVLDECECDIEYVSLKRIPKQPNRIVKGTVQASV